MIFDTHETYAAYCARTRRGETTLPYETFATFCARTKISARRSHTSDAAVTLQDEKEVQVQGTCTVFDCQLPAFAVLSYGLSADVVGPSRCMDHTAVEVLKQVELRQSFSVRIL